jgi:glycine/D-amino acid oxidase-like deaminating enzyme
MANVVVVGGGFAGMSAAARLAKLRHHVTLLETGQQLGGRLNGVTVGGRTWQTELDTVTLPGVFRDLFRKSGRPLERVLELTKTEGRRHVFKDSSILDLPLGNRGDQHGALMAAFGEDEWSPWVDTFAEPWDIIRRMALDQVFAGRPAVDRKVRRSLRPRRSLAALAAKDIDDDRLRKLVLDPPRLAGQDRRATPGFVAVSHYVERSFGRWRFAGGLPALTAALGTRLDERGVTVELGESAHELVITDGQVRGVVTSRRTVPAEVVVWCAPTWPAPLPPRQLMPVIPASRTLVALSSDAPAMPDEILVHANPPIRMWTGGDDLWTIEHRSGEDPLRTLVRFGIDVRPYIEQRVDLSPSELVRLGHWGWTWRGWTSALELPGVAPTGGVHFAGAHAHPGATLEGIGVATASIAEAIGRAPR